MFQIVLIECFIMCIYNYNEDSLCNVRTLFHFTVKDSKSITPIRLFIYLTNMMCLIMYMWTCCDWNDLFYVAHISWWFSRHNIDSLIVSIAAREWSVHYSWRLFLWGEMTFLKIYIITWWQEFPFPFNFMVTKVFFTMPSVSTDCSITDCFCGFFYGL